MAGYSLPSIARRTSSRALTHTLSEPYLASVTRPVTATTLVVHPPTPPPVLALASTLPRPDETVAVPESDSSSGSSDGSLSAIIVRSKRVRGQRSSPRTAAEEFTLPPPATRSKPATYMREPNMRARVVGPYFDREELSDSESPQSGPPVRQNEELSKKIAKLRLNFETVPTRHVSESHADTLMEPESLPTPLETVSAILPYEARLLRKKSGEPIKSSLKSAKPPGLSVVTKSSQSKSEPCTPSQSKVVHFDSKLEHVKLFLAGQKPLAVSRDGSPTDTSGADNEFPSFIYGHSSDEEEPRKSLVVRVTNMRKREADADIMLQGLTLSQDSTSIYGRVRVKNIAFEKRLAVRFTFDWWQTTSEVTAKYVESLEGNHFDIFGFTIRLNGLMTRIEEKVLFLALRYTVAGREIWDNNGGENYLAKFTTSKVQQRKGTSDGNVSSGRAITHLTSKLEQVARGRDSGASFLAQRVHRQAGQDLRHPSKLQLDKSLSARYDFSASLKNNTWKTGSPTPPTHIGSSAYPSSPNTIPWPQKPPPVPVQGCDLRSRSSRSRDPASPASDDVMCPQAAQDSGTLFNLPSRRHHRGYFDRPLPDISGVKMTPPGMPLTPSPNTDVISNLTAPSMPRFKSFPPPDASRHNSPCHDTFATTFVPTWAALHVPSGGSEESTPSISSPSSSRTTSPSLSPTENFKYEPDDRCSSREISPASPGSSWDGHDNYSSFLNRSAYIQIIV